MLCRRWASVLASCASEKSTSTPQLTPSWGTGAVNLEQAPEAKLWPCGYQAQCKVRSCKAKATIVARSIDNQDRPMRQYELCHPHTDQVVKREQGRGREIVNFEVGN